MKCLWLLFTGFRSPHAIVKHYSSALLVAASLCLLPARALASRLASWRFDNVQNRLEFTTDQDVQPTAQLLADPTRLVIDLPGITLGRPSFNHPVGNSPIRSVRFGQFNQETARIVVELAPGYTLDPAQVRFRGITARQWEVQIPQPQPLTPQLVPSAGRLSPTRTDSIPGTSAPSGGDVIVPTLPPITAGGLINRQPPKIASENPRSAIAPKSPSLAQNQMAVVESVQIEAGGSQLVIRANQALKYESGWDRRTNAYRITIRSAQLANQVKGPQLDARSPILQVRLRQEDASTVVVLVQPSAGVQIGDLNQPTLQTLALQLQRPQLTRATQQPGPTSSVRAPRPNTPLPTIAQIPNGRIVVVVDPGHGGPDPGAVGIGGLREKDIVLDISTQVASLLERQGVQAVLTRSNDVDLDLEPRVQMAEQARATVFVSIHANSIDMSRPDVNGLETYYYNSGADLAQTIHNSVLAGTGINDRGVRTARFYVLRRTSMPSVLVEVGFVTGRDDAARLSNPSYRSQMAAAIARGILQYIQRMARS